VKRGNVVCAELPRPAGSSGHEQFGTRPAIIVQDDSSFVNLSTVVVVPLTSKLVAAKFSGSFIISPDKSNGLTVRSVVLVQQIRAIDIRRITGVMGSLSDIDMETLERELRKLLCLR
jgi:mRNA interferase MazF